MRLTSPPNPTSALRVHPVPVRRPTLDRPLRRLLSAAFVAFGLALSGCGGGGAGGGLSGPRFRLPEGALTRSIGAPIAIDVEGFEPGALVSFALDTDGDALTSADRVPFGLDLVASASGDVVGFVNPGPAEPGTYRLVAASAASVAVSSARLTLVSHAFARLVEGASSQQLERVAVLGDGRIVVTGSVYGGFEASTAAGPVSTAPIDGYDVLVSVLDREGGYASAWTIEGPGSEAAYDVAAQPEGGFTLVGFHDAGISSAIGAIPGSLTYSVGPPKGSEWAGFAAGYTADGSLVRFDSAHPPQTPPTPGYGTCFSALAVQPDGRRLYAWSGSGVVGFGDVGTVDFGAAGAALVRLGTSEVPEAMFLFATGFVQIEAIAVRDDGGLVVAGFRWGTTTYAPGTAGSITRVDDATRMFVARLTADGELLALFEPEATGPTDAYGLALRPDGGVFVVGSVSGLATFAPGVVIDATGHESFGFLARLDAGLVPLWASPWVSEGIEAANPSSSATCVAVVATPDGGCVVAARSRYWMTFDDANVGDGTGEQLDSLVTRHAANGDLVFALELTGPSGQEVADLALDETGAVVIVGSTYGTMKVADMTGKSFLLSPDLVDGTAGFVLRVDADGLLR